VYVVQGGPEADSGPVGGPERCESNCRKLYANLAASQLELETQRRAVALQLRALERKQAANPAERTLMANEATLLLVLFGPIWPRCLTPESAIKKFVKWHNNRRKWGPETAEPQRGKGIISG
jgi:hypothetical protein